MIIITVLLFSFVLVLVSSSGLSYSSFDRFLILFRPPSCLSLPFRFSVVLSSSSLVVFLIFFCPLYCSTSYSLSSFSLFSCLFRISFFSFPSPCFMSSFLVFLLPPSPSIFPFCSFLFYFVLFLFPHLFSLLVISFFLPLPLTVYSSSPAFCFVSSFFIFHFVFSFFLFPFGFSSFLFFI